jgi:hypothetical protein
VGEPPDSVQYALTTSIAKAFSSPLKIIVGKNKQKFYVNKGLICEESKFFRAACKEYWASGTNNLVTLNEDDPGIFAIFLVWLPTGTINSCGYLIQTSTIDAHPLSPASGKKDRPRKELILFLGLFDSPIYHVIEPDTQVHGTRQ